MANGNGNGNGTAKVTWNIAIPIGALGLLGALMLDISKDSGHMQKVMEQHGEEMLLLKGDIHGLEQDMRERTQLRYTSKDADRDFKYLLREIEACKLTAKEHSKDAHKK